MMQVSFSSTFTKVRNLTGKNHFLVSLQHSQDRSEVTNIRMFTFVHVCLHGLEEMTLGNQLQNLLISRSQYHNIAFLFNE